MLVRARVGPNRTPSLFVVAGVLLSALALPAAAAQRTFVHSSPLGNDGNAALSPPCTQAAPCRTFAIAIGVTDPGGEIVALDTAGYGSVTINKSIKILAPGVYGGISVLGGVVTPTTGIVINAGDTDDITLRGLDITGIPSAAPLPLIGIDIQNAGAVHVQSTSISGFGSAGGACVRVDSLHFGQVFLVDSFVRECATGLRVNSSIVTNRIQVGVENTRFENMSTAGLSLSGAYAVNLRNSSVISANIGVLTSDTIDNTFSRLNVDDSLFTWNYGAAIKTTGSGTASPIFALANSRFHQNNAVVLHGFGSVSLDRVTVITGANSFVNCGSGSITSAGNNTINMMGDSSLPAGCSSYITSFFTVAPK